MTQKLKLTDQEALIASFKKKSIRKAKRSKLFGIFFTGSPILLFLFGLHNKLETWCIVSLTIILVIIGLASIRTHTVHNKTTELLENLIN